MMAQLGREGKSGAYLANNHKGAPGNAKTNQIPTQSANGIGKSRRVFLIFLLFVFFFPPLFFIKYFSRPPLVIAVAATHTCAPR